MYSPWGGTESDTTERACHEICFRFSSIFSENLFVQSPQGVEV